MASAIVALGANAAADKVWEGSYDYGNWADPVTIDSPKFDEAKAGDVITLVYASVEAGAQYQLAFNDNDNYIMAVEYAEIAGKMATYTLTGKTVGTSTMTDVEMLAAGGFFTKGQNAVLAEVYFGEEYVPAKPSGVETVWEGEGALGTWNKEVNIGTNGGVFDNLFDGDKIVFTFADAASDAQAYLSTKVGSNWLWTTFFKGDVIVNNKLEAPVANNMTGEDPDGKAVEFDISTIKARGIIVKGQNATLVKVEIDHGQGGGSAVKTIAVEDNAPVEIYTLDGRRVNAMENGIYIVRQGNNVKKVIK